MIKLNDLIHRDYLGNICYAFDYKLNDFLFSFVVERIDDDFDDRRWKITIIPPDGNITRIGFEVPKKGLSLTMICAIGLKYYQNILKAEIQMKSELDFDIGDVTSDMMG